MRTENEMMDLIISTAKNNDLIRALILNGSRANNFAPQDKYQDYDIIYLATNLEYFIDNKNWIDIFGNRIMLEMPIYKDLDPSDYNGRFNYQMLFTDGNRIDLTFASVNKATEVIENNKMGKILLDKDNLLNNAHFDNGEMFFITKPSKRDFENKCNSFWWITQNVAKGIKRKELPYAMKMLNIARESLDDMVSWHIGMNNDYSISAGKMGKYLEKYLDSNLWEKYVSTFPSGKYDAVWNALFSSCELFRQLAIGIADEYSYEYPYGDDGLMMGYLRGMFFEMKLNTPNDETIAAIQDVNANKNISRPFKSIKELMEDLDADN